MKIIPSQPYIGFVEKFFVKVTWENVEKGLGGKYRGTNVYLYNN